MTRGTSRALTAWLLVSLLGLAPEAQAYLDPSTGSMILSAIIGLFATAALAVKTYWYRLKALFRRKSGGPGQTPAAPTGPEREPDRKPAAD